MNFGLCRKALKNRHLDVPSDAQSGRQDFCQRIPPPPRKQIMTVFLVRFLLQKDYFSRNRFTWRRTAEYIRSVTRPVCVFCWLG